MLSDFVYIYLFWIAIFIIGIIFLPLSCILFRKFVDKGYIFSKVLGIAFISYTVWFLSSVKILPFNLTSILIVTAFWFIVNIFLLRTLKPHFSFNKYYSIIKIALIEEILFFMAFIFWSYIRGFNPEIHGLEKFMDFGFVESLMRTKYMPPLDMWLSYSPDFKYNTINYYYYGHFVTAMLAKLTTITPEIVYNLMLGLLFAFTFLGSFSISLNLISFVNQKIKNLKNLSYPKMAIIFAFIAGFIVAMAGNLHTIYIFTKGYPAENPVPFWEVLGTPNIGAYWYPNATRFIPNTIHEFPIYSFVVSDLHGHVSDIPFVLLTIAYLLSILISNKSLNNQYLKTPARLASESVADRQNFKLKLFGFKNLPFKLDISVLPFEIILLGLLLSIMYMTNAWDGLIYFVLSAMILFISNSSADIKISPSYFTMKLRLSGKVLFLNLINFIYTILFLGCFFLLFSFVFNRNFIPFAKGVGVNCITPNATGDVLCNHSPLWMMGILWGHFYYFAVSFLILILIPGIINFFKGIEANKNKIFITDLYIFCLIILSTFLLIAPEFIFARDIYPVHYRANTMFKLGYQAFMMLGIVISYVLFRFFRYSPFTSQKAKNFKDQIIHKLTVSLWWKLALIILFLVSIYPLFAVNSYYDGLRSYKSLDGLLWLWKTYPGDRAAVDYFRKSLGEFDQPVILEAVGDSYTDYGRISANTGLPTVLGWPVHEWLWRGSYNEPGKRVEEVKQMYEATSLESLKVLLKKYNVQYVIVGSLEKDKYPNLNEYNFYELGTTVFYKGNTRIYKLNI